MRRLGGRCLVDLIGKYASQSRNGPDGGHLSCRRACLARRAHARPIVLPAARPFPLITGLVMCGNRTPAVPSAAGSGSVPGPACPAGTRHSSAPSRVLRAAAHWRSQHGAAAPDHPPVTGPSTTCNPGAASPRIGDLLALAAAMTDLAAAIQSRPHPGKARRRQRH